LATHFKLEHFISTCAQVGDFKEEAGGIILSAKDIAAAARHIQSVQILAAKLARRHNLRVEFHFVLDLSRSVR
jgi:hypothetical protein